MAKTIKQKNKVQAKVNGIPDTPVGNQSKQSKFAELLSGFSLVEMVLFGSFFLWMIGTAIVGTMNNYTALPVWDVWDAGIRFYLKSGDLMEWWQQMSFHRLVLERALCWIEFALFGGVGIFLLVANFVFLGLIGLICWYFLQLANENKKLKKGEIALGLFMLGWLYHYGAYEVITMWICGSFILAMLLPIVSFYWLARFLTPPNNLKHYVASLMSAFLATFTMAHGLAIPVLVLFGFCLSWRDIAWSKGKKLLIILSSLCLVCGYTGLYLQGYQSETNLVSNATSYLTTLAHYVVLYFGNVFYWSALGWGASYVFAKGAATIFGLIFVGLSLFLFVGLILTRVYTKKFLINNKAVELCLALLLGFLWLSAIASGAGRGVIAKEGADYALVTSRYAFFSVVSWICVLLWISPIIFRVFQQRYVFLFGLLLSFSVFLGAFQKVVFKKPYEFLFYRNVAGVSLALGVKDLQVVKSIYPAPENILQIAETAVGQKISTFGHYPWVGLREKLGEFNHTKANSVCQFSIDMLSGIQEDSRFVRVHGSIFEPLSKTIPQLIYLLDSKDKVLGVALSGLPDPKRSATSQNILLAGFLGYVKTEEITHIHRVLGYDQDGEILCGANIK